MAEQVHWHEGLFLQPQHLQCMQRMLLDQLVAERRLAVPYPWGVVEARLSPDAMENRLIRFDKLRAVMPSGAEVDFPEAADLPQLDIAQALEATNKPLTVYLGVPAWYASQRNVVDDPNPDAWKLKRRFKVAEVQQTDENTGEGSQPVMVRRVNARLVLEHDDRRDIEVIPLLRIVRATGQALGLPREDPRFIPPCFVLAGSTVLRNLVRDLADQIDASRKELVREVTHGTGFSVDAMRGKQFEQVMRLRALNRAAARLPALVAAPATTPLTMYLELRELLAELAALQPDRDEMLFPIPAYDHENPYVAFLEIEQRIRPILKRAVQSRVDQLEFRKEQHFFAADLTDAHLTRPNEYYLGIRTKEDPQKVAKLVEDLDRFKFMPKSMIQHRVWGIKLAEERHPPLDLPSQVGLSYFRLIRTDSQSQLMWNEARKVKSIAVRWPDMATSDFQLTLYMTIPAAAGGPGVPPPPQAVPRM